MAKKREMGQPPGQGEFLLYQTEDGKTRIECRFEQESLWLFQGGMAELFQTSKQNIAKHLKAIFAEGELDAEAVVNHWLTTAADGKRYTVAHYNLNAILAVGYRVRSVRGTQFRRWATARLEEYLVKGFTMDDERLKNAARAGGMCKKAAEAHAMARYEQFAAFLGAEGVNESVRAMEASARLLTGKYGVNHEAAF